MQLIFSFYYFNKIGFNDNEEYMNNSMTKFTLSGTVNGMRPCSANALSQDTVAHACGSWFP